MTSITFITYNLYLKLHLLNYIFWHILKRHFMFWSLFDRLWGPPRSLFAALQGLGRWRRTPLAPPQPNAQRVSTLGTHLKEEFKRKHQRLFFLFSSFFLLEITWNPLIFFVFLWFFPCFLDQNGLGGPAPQAAAPSSPRGIGPWRAPQRTVPRRRPRRQEESSRPFFIVFEAFSKRFSKKFNEIQRIFKGFRSCASHASPGGTSEQFETSTTGQRGPRRLDLKTAKREGKRRKDLKNS